MQTATALTTIEILEKGWEGWPSPVVARSEVGKFTGGLIAPRSIANYDSLKKGPKGKVRLGRNVGYLKADLIEWLLSRLGA